MCLLFLLPSFIATSMIRAICPALTGALIIQRTRLGNDSVARSLSSLFMFPDTYIGTVLVGRTTILRDKITAVSTSSTLRHGDRIREIRCRRRFATSLLTYPPEVGDEAESISEDKGDSLLLLDPATTWSRKATDITEEPLRQVQMLASSKHLMHSTPVYKAMLRHGNFKIGNTLLADGKVAIPLPDDDPAAFKILLDIIHCNPRKVPRIVDLQTMANLSILVNKYQLGDVVEIYADLWILGLSSSIPTTLKSDLLPWLSIAWVFRMPAESRVLTRIVERESDGTLGKDIEIDLPIPTRVLGMESLQISSTCTNLLRHHRKTPPERYC